LTVTFIAYLVHKAVNEEYTQPTFLGIFEIGFWDLLGIKGGTLIAKDDFEAVRPNPKGDF
jgi:hypothetical protein